MGEGVSDDLILFYFMIKSSKDDEEGLEANHS